jgi:hypothetical protein
LGWRWCRGQELLELIVGEDGPVRVLFMMPLLLSIISLPAYPAATERFAW